MVDSEVLTNGNCEKGYNMNLKNIFLHLKKIIIHKYWVLYFCIKAGIPLQGIMHDISKFSPLEFIEGVKYYQGNRSPIDACKEDNGYSAAWLHHKGRNPHHYEYWQDNFDNGGHPLKMPYKYALEMVCDYLGAGKAYMGKDFTIEKEYQWWLNKSSKPIAMHPHTKKFVGDLLLRIKEDGTYDVLRDYSRAIYDTDNLNSKYWG